MPDGRGGWQDLARRIGNIFTAFDCGANGDDPESWKAPGAACIDALDVGSDRRKNSLIIETRTAKRATASSGMISNQAVSSYERIAFHVSWQTNVCLQVCWRVACGSTRARDPCRGWGVVRWPS